MHREKWRRWKQLRVSDNTHREKRSKPKDVAETSLQHEHQGSPPQQQQQQELYEKTKLEQQQQQHSPPKHVQEKTECNSQDEKQAKQGERGTDDKEFEVQDAAEWKQEKRQQQQQQDLLQEKSRPSDIALETWKSASPNDQAWTILSRDDAKGAAIDEQQEWEENNAGLRRRLVAPNSDETPEEAATESKKYVGTESSIMNERGFCSKGTGDAAKDVGTHGVHEDSLKGGDSGIAAAGQLVAAAAQEGAAAVAREDPEEGAAAGGEKEMDTADKQRDYMDSEKLERQSLEKYFVMANANVIGMLHALYLTPAALYYSIRNVVLPAAELVLAERAAVVASTTKPVDPSHGSHPAAAAAATAAGDVFDSNHLSPHRHLYDLLNTYFLHWEKAPSFWDGSSDCVVIFSAYVMTSYFVWDTADCFQHYKVHGRAFFFHALLSLLCGLLQVSARGLRLAGLCSMFAVSEISTPFLHFRWFLIQNGLGGSRLCTVTTLWTVFLFILVRAFMVPCLVFSHYWGDLLFYHKYILREDAKISVLRALFMSALTVAWTGLNLFWCFLFFRSLIKRRRHSSRVAGSDKCSTSRSCPHQHS